MTHIYYQHFEYKFLKEYKIPDFDSSINSLLCKYFNIQPIIQEIDKNESTTFEHYKYGYKVITNHEYDKLVKIYCNCAKYIAILPILDCVNPILTNNYDKHLCVDKFHMILVHNYYSKHKIHFDSSYDDLSLKGYMFKAFGTKTFENSLHLDKGFKYGFLIIHSSKQFSGIKLQYDTDNEYIIQEHQCLVLQNEHFNIYCFTSDPSNIPFSEIFKFKITDEPSIIHVTDEYCDTNGHDMIYLDNCHSYIQHKFIYNKHVVNSEAITVPFTMYNVPYTNTHINYISNASHIDNKYHKFHIFI